MLQREKRKRPPLISEPERRPKEQRKRGKKMRQGKFLRLI